MRDLEEEDKYVFFATRKGTVKKTALKDFSNVMSRGIIAIGIEKDDELVAARSPTASRSSSSPRTRAWPSASTKSDVRPMGRPAYGVRGMNLDEEGLHRRHGGHRRRCLAAKPSGAKPNGKKKNGDTEEEPPAPNLILTVTENGYGKRTPVDEYRLQSRGGKGVINVKTTERNGKVVGHPAGERRVRSHADHPVRQDHPHGHRLTSARPDAPPRASACSHWKAATRSPPPSSSPRRKR